METQLNDRHGHGQEQPKNKDGEEVARLHGGLGAGRMLG